ncbi:MAG: isochorismate synthase [Deltaproteobacteria bacterium]|nr:isochorismate synthase [Deltaproteobacteria bacterium]
MSASFPYAEVACRLPRLLAAGQQEAARRGHAMLVSVTVDIPPVEPAVLFSQTPSHERILWEQPSQDLSMVAFGAATRLNGHGKGRFSQLSAGWCGLLSRALVDAVSSCPLPTPISLGGFAFDPTRRADSDWEEYPDALLVIPRFLFLSCAGSSWLTVNMLVTPDCDRQAAAAAVVGSLCTLQGEEGAGIGEESSGCMEVQQDEAQAVRWKEKVLAVVREIESGALEKLVLARSVHVHSPQSFDPGAVLRKLCAGYRHCTLFAFASRQRCFVGATPERLVRLEGRTVRTDCLAGSTRRGATDDEDRTLGEALLADRKEQREHALVMRALRNMLEPLCVRFSVPETPSLLGLPNVQHLHTPVEGELKEASDIFTLVAALHPTPATGGLPRETACSLLRTYEDFDRGWYAGPVGWVDGQGGGEFAVAIRSALLRGREARLYAGCGIVAGSDPEREYTESCLKLRPMLWALNSTQV